MHSNTKSTFFTENNNILFFSEIAKILVTDEKTVFCRLHQQETECDVKPAYISLVMATLFTCYVLAGHARRLSAHTTPTLYFHDTDYLNYKATEIHPIYQ